MVATTETGTAEPPDSGSTKKELLRILDRIERTSPAVRTDRDSDLRLILLRDGLRSNVPDAEVAYRIYSFLRAATRFPVSITGPDVGRLVDYQRALSDTLNATELTTEMEPISEAVAEKRKIDATLARFTAVHDEMVREEQRRRSRRAKFMPWLASDDKLYAPFDHPPVAEPDQSEPVAVERPGATAHAGARRWPTLRGLLSRRAPSDRAAVDVTLYLDEETDAFLVEQRLSDVLGSTGLKVEHSDVRLGSWLRLLRVRTGAVVKSDEFRRRAGNVERSLELYAVDRQQAEVDAAQGDVVAKLITSLDNTQNALIQIGSVLLIKVDGMITVRNLSQVEIAHLQRNPELIKEPGRILRELQQLANQGARQVTAAPDSASRSIQSVPSPGS